MRTLAKNKSSLWIVEPTGKTPLLDSDGFDTGEYTIGYSTPTEVMISLYPSNGAISERIFGKDTSFDMMAVSNEVTLTENTLLFSTEPTSNFATTYTYDVTAIKKSLNTTNYALRKRT